jgi:hypothetical protein
MINDIGELLSRENIKLYEQVILEHFNFDKKFNAQEEKEFLYKLYKCLVDKLKEINFEENKEDN